MKVLVIGMNHLTKSALNGKMNATFKKLESWMTEREVKRFLYVNTFDVSLPHQSPRSVEQCKEYVCNR
jgi:hypothetical protein